MEEKKAFTWRLTQPKKALRPLDETPANGCPRILRILRDERVAWRDCAILLCELADDFAVARRNWDTRMMTNRDPHQALKSEIVSRHSGNYLEAILVRLQWGKDDIAFSAHVNSSSYSTSGIQQTDFLTYLGFSASDCSFSTGRKCFTRWVDESYDPKAFVDAFNSAYALLVHAEEGLQKCGFALQRPEGWGYFYGKASRSSGNSHSGLSGDGHIGTKIESMRKSEDDAFLYRFAWIETAGEKGWVTHYQPKHPPLSSELQGIFTYLGLQ